MAAHGNLLWEQRPALCLLPCWPEASGSAMDLLKGESKDIPGMTVWTVT